MKSKITPILITIAIIGFVVWKLVENKQTLDKNAELSLVVNTVIPVTVDKPQYKSIDQRFSVNGRIVSGNEVTINAKTNAVVVKKYKKAGDAVNKGTVIAQLENEVIRENLRIAEMDYAKAQKDVERFQKLAANGAVTTRELEENQIALRNTESRISGLKDQLANTTIVSPANGIIDKDFFEEGTLLSVGGQIASIVNDKTLKMKITVTDKEMLKLRKGDKVFITADIYSDKVFTGIVDVIAPKGNELYNYFVELVLSGNNSKELKPGMYATATFNADGNDKKTMVIDRKAIVGGMKDPYVFVVRENKAYKVSVQIGQVDTDYVEITKGISANDSVLISGQINLKDGSEITIIG
jgi:RND family efflux transporter MFP subunit